MRRREPRQFLGTSVVSNKHSSRQLVIVERRIIDISVVVVVVEVVVVVIELDVVVGVVVVVVVVVGCNEARSDAVHGRTDCRRQQH